MHRCVQIPLEQAYTMRLLQCSFCGQESRGLRVAWAQGLTRAALRGQPGCMSPEAGQGGSSPPCVAVGPEVSPCHTGPTVGLLVTWQFAALRGFH